MALSAGSMLGPYEILSLVGAGGMGEVYRARDTRLDRIVAIKVLPPHLSEDPSLKQRFEREARTISSLNHPHICALYDIGHQSGTDYLVIEYLEGESMAHRLHKGALPTQQVLRYGIQISEALDKAHRQGIVHRDLKPGNIMLTKSGAKLLDFGLAKYHESKTSNAGRSQSETRYEPLTEEGVILGTVQYMSPEQLEGREADQRTDIFALGEVLYEMSTGQRTFNGRSKAELMAAILSLEPPPLSTVQPLAPPALDHVVKKCLAKDPEDRWQDAGDVASELKWIAESSSHASMPAPVATRRKTREGRILWATIATLVVAMCVLSVAYYGVVKQPARPIRLSIVAPEGTSFTGNLMDSTMVAVSPDGSKVAFAATSLDGSSRLWLRDMDSLAGKPLAGTEGATFPFWSPNSRNIGFFADGKLKTIDLAGTQPQILCEARTGRGGSWSREGVIVFAPNMSSSLSRVSDAGGTPVSVTTLDNSRSETTHRWPHFLPDGRHFLYFAWSGQEQEEAIYTASLDSRERKPVFSGNSSMTRGNSSMAYAAGHLFFVHDQTLVAQVFNAKQMELSGEQFPIAENVGRWGAIWPIGYSPFSVSEQGVLAYGRVEAPTTQLTWFDLGGKELETVGPAGSYSGPFFSPDQKHVAAGFIDPKTGRHIWLLDLSHGTLSRFTFGTPTEWSPCWSPDGGRIAYSSIRLGHADLYQSVATGAGNEELLLKSDVDKWCDDWTRDGRYIVFENSDPKNKIDLWILPAFGDKKPNPILQTEFNEAHAQVSPDSHWIAYVSDESGKAEVYVRPFPSMAGGKWQISASGGDQPQWRSDGKELFYLSPDAKLMEVEVQSGSSFEASVPKPLFQTHVPGMDVTGQRNHYLVSTDGRRFLINKVAEKQNSTPITVVVNWPALLKR